MITDTYDILKSLPGLIIFAFLSSLTREALIIISRFIPNQLSYINTLFNLKNYKDLLLKMKYKELNDTGYVSKVVIDILSSILLTLLFVIYSYVYLDGVIRLVCAILFLTLYVLFNKLLLTVLELFAKIIGRILFYLLYPFYLILGFIIRLCVKCYHKERLLLLNLVNRAKKGGN